KATNADLLLATDPDADRVGIAVKNGDEYRLLTGNETGVLLLDYLAKSKIENGTMPKDPVLVKSIVTTSLADEVAKSYGITPINVLTGFKFIGEKIAHLEEKGEEKRFLLGFEESYGYLSGTYVRDKDAVVASMLIVEMAAYYNSINSSILEELEKIYKKFGRYLNKVDSFEFDGLSGMEKMKEIMANLRANPPKEAAGFKVVKISDYKAHTVLEVASGNTEKIDLPAANVLVYDLENGSSFIVRPSGTEPKIKVYYSTKGSDLAQAEALRVELAKAVNKILGF
ncbi:MAG: phospho-sugar mutase, partial [Oscillospiraceae bacterium]